MTIKNPKKHSRFTSELLEMIQSGEFPIDSLLPAEDKLAKQMGISRHTVRQAYNSLENSGVIRRIQGHGTVVRRLKPFKRLPHIDVVYNSSTQGQDLTASDKNRGLLSGISHTCSASSYSLNIIVMGIDSLNDSESLLQKIENGVIFINNIPDELEITLNKNKLPFRVILDEDKDYESWKITGQKTACSLIEMMIKADSIDIPYRSSRKHD